MSHSYHAKHRGEACRTRYYAAGPCFILLPDRNQTIFAAGFAPGHVDGLDHVKRNSLHSASPAAGSRKSFLSAPSVFLTNFKAKCFEIERRSSEVNELSASLPEANDTELATTTLCSAAAASPDTNPSRKSWTSSY